METRPYELCVTGTDATHAEHIETIKSRMYVGLTADQRFLPGELGMGLVEGMYTITLNIIICCRLKNMLLVNYSVFVFV